MYHHFAELDGPTLVRSTWFHYNTNPHTQLSLLGAVTVKGHRRTDTGTEIVAEMPPITFEYSEFKPHQQRYRPLEVIGEHKTYLPITNADAALVDLFGDGLPDVLQTGVAGFRYWKNMGNGFFDRPQSLPSGPAGISLSLAGVAFADMDGDGRNVGFRRRSGTGQCSVGLVGLFGVLAGAVAGGQHIAAGLGALGGAYGTWANQELTQAGFERRWEEWNLQAGLANLDAQIADIQVSLSEDRVDISNKEFEIPGLQYVHAQKVYDFLQNKTLNKELFEWMVSVLIDQYRTIMQSAAATSQLAQRALEFEWQVPITIVKGDYWTVDAPTLREDQKSYGLLGAERLTVDLNRLDDFRLSLGKRRLQLSKTISLAQRLPVDFMQLRSTGRIEFDTLIDWFDEDYPGNYLRLIKSVRVSVLALVPPIDGLHATLTNTGASTVQFPDRPPQRSLRTLGESIALHSGYNETGLFVFDYNDPLLLPFEGLGVEAHWIFELPRASNRFNFDTIADVLLTIEYTALHDDTFAERVRQRLGSSRSANSLMSLRSNFPDQWYHLQNPTDPTQTQIVAINIPRAVYRAGIENLVLRHLTVVIAPAPSVDIPTLKAALPQNAITITVGGIDVIIDGASLDQNSGSVTTMSPTLSGSAPFTDPTFDGHNVVPFGSWEIKIAPDLYTLDSNNARKLDLISDIILVPTIEGVLS